MPKSASPPGMRTCRIHGPEPESEFDRLPTRWDYYCRAYRKAQAEAAEPPAPIPQGDGTSKIPLIGSKGRGLVQLIDDDDLPQLSVHRWWAQGRRRPDGSWASGPYAATQINRQWITAHQMLAGQKGADHVNRDTLDNTRKNLRAATQAQNSANQGKRRGKNGAALTSRFKGVHLVEKVRKWKADLGLGGTQLYLGLFVEEERAARAYDAAALKHRPERTPTNVDLGLLPPLPPGVVIECSCRGCLGKPAQTRPRVKRLPPPPDLVAGLSPELRATAAEVFDE